MHSSSHEDDAHMRGHSSQGVSVAILSSLVNSNTAAAKYAGSVSLSVVIPR
jgi:hypothetical protein